MPLTSNHSENHDLKKMKAVLTASAALIFVLSPLYARGFRGFEPSQFPIPQIDPPTVPAGYAFSIWGVIYALLFAHAIFGLVKRDVDPHWDATRWPMIVSLGLGASWLSVAQVSPGWATVLIWLMLASSLVALFRSASAKDHFLLSTPLALYAGWLTAASFVSVALFGAGYGVLTDEVGWAWLAMILAVCFASFVQLKLNDRPEYGLAVCWGLVAIAVSNWTSETALTAFALIAAAALGLLALRNKIGQRLRTSSYSA